MDSAILATAYMGPVQYFSKFLLCGTIRIEKHENFIKQTYRNRCMIPAANGPLTLTVPVRRGSFHKVPIKDLEIDDHTDWRKNHLSAIHSAYRSSPFFEYYRDDLETRLMKKTQYLLDLNHRLTEMILGWLGIDTKIQYTKDFVDPGRNPFTADYREKISPKTNTGNDPHFRPAKYRQVFEDRWGFQTNMSIIDLIFNQGASSLPILRSSLKMG